MQLQGGGRTAGTDPTRYTGEIAEEFANRRLAVLADAVERFAAGRGTGLAVEGLAEVTAALRDGAVDTLIIGDLGGRTVVADHDQLLMCGPDAATVSALGGSPTACCRPTRRCRCWPSRPGPRWSAQTSGSLRPTASERCCATPTPASTDAPGEQDHRRHSGSAPVR